MAAESSLIDLRDIEIKLGRKVPESLAKSLKEEHCDWMKDARDGHAKYRETPDSLSQSNSLERLERKLQLLKQDMIYLRATDVKLMRQLLIINESIESIKWMMEEKDVIMSQGSSLSGSLCSLLESQDSSLHGSCNSLHIYSDGMDDISVGSYLDTLADIVPGHCTPSDFDQYSDTQENDSTHQAMCNNSNSGSDEYYCFR
ncbi:leucine rich adaptor protein 1-like [Bombina bombina]|uniref:leucine rich adaptor protein 1-like n=1 Tax=Bombina bombina TaxID=8345 RepID=UPI00235AE88C|nr:leucine rich adaptor protein 1-like [Bombina bombina]